VARVGRPEPTDEEYAKRTPYKGRIAPSSFTMSVSTAMTEGLFRHSIIALLSVDHGRFHSPVRAGDTIRTEVEVVSKRETSAGDRGLVVFRDHVLNQRDQVVFQIDKTTLIKRRTAAA